MEQIESRHTPFPSYGSLLLTIGLIAFPASIEIFFSLPLPRYAYLGYAAAGSALLWWWNERRWANGAMATVLVFCAALACIHVIPWSPRKVFLVRFSQIEPGMTVHAVDKMLASYRFSENRSTRRDMERSYRHSTIGRYDSDCGVIRFRDDQVVETRFIPD